MRVVSLLLLLMACLAIVAVFQAPISANADSANSMAPLHQWLADCDGSTRCSEVAPQTPPPPGNPLIPWLDPKLRLALEQYKSARTEQDAFSAFNLVLLALPKFQDGSETLYLLEADQPSSHEEVCSWITRITGKAPPSEAACPSGDTTGSTVTQSVGTSNGDELVAASNPNCRAFGPERYQADALCIWNEQDRSRLKYAIDKSTFIGVPAEVVQDLERAIDDAVLAWANACPSQICGLKFSKVEMDSLSPVDKLDFRFFSISYVPICGFRPNETTFASSFYPYVNHLRWAGNRPKSPPSQQTLNVYAPLLQIHSKWNGLRCPFNAQSRALAWSHTLKHEVGHILGYRHEQLIEPDFAACVLNGDRIPTQEGGFDNHPIAPGDRYSIMHQTGCRDLGFVPTGELSQQDKTLHTQFYRRY